MLKNFEGIPGSLALDAMMVNNSGAKISQIRSGAALCGINVWPGKLNLEPVMTIEAPVLQTEQIKKGDTVGYGATFTAQTDTKIAVIGIGYSNGIPRSLSNKGKVFFSDGDNMYEAPIVGRISMGLLNCDVTNVPEKALRTKKASIINKNTRSMIYALTPTGWTAKSCVLFPPWTSNMFPMPGTKNKKLLRSVC